MIPHYLKPAYSALFKTGHFAFGAAGDLYFIKSNQLHGISNASDKPCKYFAIRWN